MQYCLASPRTITALLPAILALLIPNTTANHTIAYNNLVKLKTVLNVVDT